MTAAKLLLSPATVCWGPCNKRPLHRTASSTPTEPSTSATASITCGNSPAPDIDLGTRNMFLGERSLRNAPSSRSTGDSSTLIRLRSDTGSMWQIFHVQIPLPGVPLRQEAQWHIVLNVAPSPRPDIRSLTGQGQSERPIGGGVVAEHDFPAIQGDCAVPAPPAVPHYERETRVCDPLVQHLVPKPKRSPFGARTVG